MFFAKIEQFAKLRHEVYKKLSKSKYTIEMAHWQKLHGGPYLYKIHNEKKTKIISLARYNRWLFSYLLIGCIRVWREWPIGQFKK